MKSRIASAVAACVQALFDDLSRRKATKYLSPTYAVKATRQRRHDKRDRSETIIVTVGGPNYAERAFVAKCTKAKEPFPVRKVQLKFWPKKRK